MIGRPTVMTTKTLRELREAFLMGCTDKEACIYANIGVSTLYDYERNHSEYSEQKELFKLNPVFKARKTICKAIEDGDTKIAMWYLERKKGDEFGRNIIIPPTPYDIEKLLDNIEEENNKTDYAELGRQAGIERDKLEGRTDYGKLAESLEKQMNEVN